jgi:hypothetical protein
MHKYNEQTDNHLSIMKTVLNSRILFETKRVIIEGIKGMNQVALQIYRIIPYL